MTYIYTHNNDINDTISNRASYKTISSFYCYCIWQTFSIEYSYSKFFVYLKMLNSIPQLLSCCLINTVALCWAIDANQKHMANALSLNQLIVVSFYKFKEQTMYNTIVGCVAQLVERRSLTGELSLSYARPAADG